MSQINIDILCKPVRAILLAAPKGKGDKPSLMSAYQIANQLHYTEPGIYAVLHQEKGVDGPGSMFHLIAKTCEYLQGQGEVVVNDRAMSTGGIDYDVGGAPLNPGYVVCALYGIA